MRRPAPGATKEERDLWDLTSPDGADRTFRAKHLPGFPTHIRRAIAHTYRERYQANGPRPANLFLLEASERASRLPLRLSSSDEEIVEFAKLKAAKCREARIRYTSLEQQFAQAADIARAAGLQPPKETPAITLHGVLARLCDERWWRRQLRRTFGREVETIAIGAGLVHRHRAPYVSDDSLKRRQQQRRRNDQILALLAMVNELDEAFTLKDLMERSVSNPRIRRSELMARIAGFELIADELGHLGEFYTLTCPSRMHARRARDGSLNPKYDGIAPQEAQRYLNKQWQKFRAAIGRKGIKVYGIRVVEPQHDGTPHWHLLLFMLPKHVETIRQLLRHYALEMDGDEPGAAERRFQAIAIDRSQGTATGYIAKYISKNIDGHGIKGKEVGGTAKDAAGRVLAWASTWSIRQFQFIGGPSVSVWRELRRLDPDTAPEPLAALAAAADSGDWATFVRLMGGPLVGRRDRTATLHKQWDDQPNEYGEPKGYRVIGIEAEGVITLTHLRTWRIERRGATLLAERQPPDVVEIHRRRSGSATARRGVADSTAVSHSTEPAASPAPLEFCQ